MGGARIFNSAIFPFLFPWSALKRLLQYMKLLVQLGHLLALTADLSYRMQNSGVVASTKQFANFRKTLLCQFLGQVHGNLARPGDAGWPLLVIHIRNFYLVVVSHSFLDVFD